jgi:hypothetical protein
MKRRPSPVLSLGWLAIKLAVFVVLSMEIAEIVVVAYQRF